jgi:hypothetical protein
MDTKTLVVGQRVTIASGCYAFSGEPVVTEVGPDGYVVGGCRFDDEGVSCDGTGTFEGGPWTIVDLCDHALDSDEHHCKRCWSVLIPWKTA